MKTCSYCGRESSDEASHCHECGTELAGHAMEKAAEQPRDFSALSRAMMAVGLAFTVIAFYFLSLGPVSRFCTTASSTTTTLGGASFTSTTVVRYPAWASIVYYPVFSLSDGDNAFAGSYARYLDWWRK